MTGEALGPTLAGIFGALFGSFLNVCILRLPSDESVVSPPSRCPGCGSRISWYDNLPIVSWFILRGRCRRCRQSISIQYPLIELAVALIWAGMAYRYGLGLVALRGAILFTILLGIAMTDARHYLIPDEFSLGGLVLGVALSLPGGFVEIGRGLVGALIGFVVLWLVGVTGKWVFKEDAMGGGDIKMMAMVGAFVGWQGVLLTIFLGALLGSLVFVPLALIQRKRLVPFGVFLAVGAGAAFLFGPAILGWYWQFLGST
ncbi:MAG TPA: prepilin peptidase [Streptosporangiaceae bacterium]|nr:prepilin peptidase [Streptosporangiaceae bacterium]